MMNIAQAIEERISIRKYSPKSLPKERVEWIKKRFEEGHSLDSTIETRFELLTDTNIIRSLKIGFLGGMATINAPCFVAAISKMKPGYLENIGFIQEQAVLELVSEHLDTCWLGTFDKVKIREFFRLNSDETVVNLIAIGYRLEKKTFLNAGFRKMMGSPKRKELGEIAFYRNWGSDIQTYIQANPQFERILSLSIMAPSAMNAQPVRVILDEGKAIFLTKKNGCGRLDAGIFIAHFYLLCLNAGYQINFMRESDSELQLNIPDGYEYIISANWN